MDTLKIIVKPLGEFGKVNSVGIHSAPESMNDIDGAISDALRDGFLVVYIYMFLPLNVLGPMLKLYLTGFDDAVIVETETGFDLYFETSEAL